MNTILDKLFRRVSFDYSPDKVITYLCDIFIPKSVAVGNTMIHVRNGRSSVRLDFVECPLDSFNTKVRLYINRIILKESLITYASATVKLL